MRACLCALAITIGLAQLGAAEELLTNGGFKDRVPAPWKAHLGSVEISPEAASPPSALLCKPKENGELNVGQSLPGDFSGRTIRLSGKVFMRQNENQPAMVYVFTQDSSWQKIDWKPVQMIKQGDSWQDFSVSYAIPKNAPHVTVGIFSKGGGEIRIDDWSATLE